MGSEKKSEGTVRTYEKPELRVIELAADEVLAVGCKTQSKPASSGTPCWIRFCSYKGS